MKFAKAVGGMRELIKPTMRKALSELPDDALLDHLVENPGDLRRPIIVRGKDVVAGFNAEAQAKLGVPQAPAKKARK